MTIRTPLHEGWTLHLDDDPAGLVPLAVRAALPIAATVPGVVHTDLLTAGLIPDPYLDRNELELDWIGRVGWRYELSFDADPVAGDESDLAFDGLDTVATVELNGRTVATTENMHRRYRLRVTSLLRSGANSLVVRFASAWVVGEAERERLGTMPNQYPGPFNYLRKMACNFGWDWGPVLVTAGIWRPIALETWSGTRFSSVRPSVTVTGGRGIAEVAVTLAEPAPASLVLTASVAGAEARVAVAAGDRDARVRVEVDDPQLWWPRGFGEQPLFDLGIELSHDGVALDGWTERIGFRTVELDTRADADGSRFEIRINDTLLPVRGANWIPDDCFPSRITERRLRTRIEQAVGAGMNLLRVWGGGIYESEEFYRICDELGITVWQDFLFACAAYPEEERLAAEVAAEARDNVERLMPHPSLVLWNGNNENIWGFEDWDWKEPLAGRPWGLGYYLDVLPTAVAEVDPSRPYWPGSPYSGSGIHPNDPAHGTMHLWDVWNRLDYSAYRDAAPRFASEFGWQAPPSWSTIAASIHDDPLTPDSPAMLHHQKADDGQGKLTRGLAHHLPDPVGFDDWLFATQLTQARALTTGLEYFRSLRPRNAGAIVWQLNDCWPVTSWSLVDSAERLKPAWYAVRDAYAERLLTIQPSGEAEGLAVVAVSDRPETWDARIRIRRLRFDGAVLAEQTARLEVAPLGASRLTIDEGVAAPVDPRSELLVVDDGERRALWFFAEDTELAYVSELTADAVRRPDGDVELRLHSPSLARDVGVFPDRIHPDAVADQGRVTLLPGETRTIRISGIPAGRESELTIAPVLRSVADVVLAARAVTSRG